MNYFIRSITSVSVSIQPPSSSHSSLPTPRPPLVFIHHSLHPCLCFCSRKGTQFCQQLNKQEIRFFYEPRRRAHSPTNTLISTLWDSEHHTQLCSAWTSDPQNCIYLYCLKVVVIATAAIENYAGLFSGVIIQLSGIRLESYNSKLDKIRNSSQWK